MEHLDICLGLFAINLMLLAIMLTLKDIAKAMRENGRG
jgi:hypothetical protein